METKSLRDIALERAGGKCEARHLARGYRCATNKKWLDVDHIIPRSQAPELIEDPENLQVLCRRCHIIKTNYPHISKILGLYGHKAQQDELHKSAKPYWLQFSQAKTLWIKNKSKLYL